MRAQLYKTELDTAWANHLAPRQPGAPTVISTFAGGGGSSLGYSMAGFKEIVAVEIDPHAAQTLRANFHGLEIFEDSITKFDGKPYSGKIDVLDGSPPCQGFSTTGKRDISDPRSFLFLEFARLIEEIQPKVFVMENVPGMLKGRTKQFYKRAIWEFEKRGYYCQTAILNAKHFGVPQARERLFVVGNRIGKKLIWPKPCSYIITAGEAINKVSSEPSARLSDSHGKLWERVKPGKDGKAIMKTKGWSSVIVVDPQRPSRTICKTGGQGGVATMCHWHEPRALTIPEIKRLSSFPDQFKLEGKFEERWARIGNCVPPFLVRAIAQSIRESLL